MLGFAGLWLRPRTDANGVTECCTLITLPATPLMAKIDTAKARMPAYAVSDETLLEPVETDVD